MDRPSSSSSSTTAGSAATANMTMEEMLERSDDWTLACDNALLNKLQDISNNIIKSAEDLSKEFSSLEGDIKSLDSSVLNATNEFLMLANNQFVENSVQEFQELSASTPVPKLIRQKTKCEQEADLKAKMSSAIQMGIAFNESNQESNKLGTTPFVFPHLIGSVKFFSNRFCGVFDEANRHVQPTPPRQKSISVIDDDSNKPIVPIPITNSNDYEEEEDEKEKSIESNFISTISQPTPSSFNNDIVPVPAPVRKDATIPPKAKESPPPPSPLFNSDANHVTSSQIPDPAPPKLEVKKSLFFDDSSDDDFAIRKTNFFPPSDSKLDEPDDLFEDDEDFFFPKPKELPVPSKPKEIEPTIHVSIPKSDKSDIFEDSKSTPDFTDTTPSSSNPSSSNIGVVESEKPVIKPAPIASTQAQPPSSKKLQVKTSLFEDSDSGDDLFSSAASSSSAKSKDQVDKAPVKPSNTIFKAPPINESTGGNDSRVSKDFLNNLNSLLGNGNKPKDKKKVEKEEEIETEEENTIKSPTIPKMQEIQSKPTPIFSAQDPSPPQFESKQAIKGPTPQIQVKKSFFDDSDSDSDFMPISKPKSKIKFSTTNATTKKSDNLFEDNSDSEDLFSSKSKDSPLVLPKKVNDFKSVVPDLPKTDLLQETKKVTQKLPPKLQVKTSLFEDDSDSDDLFSKPKEKQKQQINQKERNPDLSGSSSSTNFLSNLNNLIGNGNPGLSKKRVGNEPSAEKNDIRHTPNSEGDSNNIDSTNLLIGVTKSRAKILHKRRPPSRQLLQKSIISDHENVNIFPDSVEPNDTKSENENI